MKKQLQDRLTKYSAAAVAVTAGVAGVNAQVMYTDVNPDYMGTTDDNYTGATGLDMDNDATADFVLFVGDTTTATPAHVRYMVVAPAVAGNSIAGEMPSAYNYALALDNAIMVDNTLNWIAASNTMAYNVDSANPYAENWNGVTDKYLGLQFDIAGAMHYGWARLDVEAIGDTYTLKDYAYDATPLTGILTGDMGPAGIEDANMDELVHFINQTDNSVLVKVNGNLTNASVTVVSADGKVVSTGIVEEGTFTVDMNGLTAGIYMINVNSVEGSITKKMMVH